MTEREEFDVVVVGAGVVGACTALELARAGATVAVVDAGPTWASGCSHANAGLLLPSHAEPFAGLRDILHGVAWMTRRDSPLGLAADHELFPWLVRLLRCSADGERMRRASATLLTLALESVAAHEQLAADGLETGFVRAGMLDVYAGRRDLAAAARAAEGPKAVLDPRVLSATETYEAEPLLRGPLAGGVLYPEEAHCDPLRFTLAVGAAAERAGARLLTSTTVTRVATTAGGARVDTDRGPLAADQVVLATGADRRLAPALPLLGGHGVSTVLDDAPAPRRPLLLHEARVAITPLPGRVRLAGTMLLGRRRPGVAEQRLRGVRAAADAAVPSWQGRTQSPAWAGARPCTPDGLPFVGRLPGRAPIVVAAGHAMLGLTLAPVTGRLVRTVLDGGSDERLTALRPDRFARR